MMKKTINLSEQNLSTDINLLSREIIHDLFILCRKAGIYSVHHPMVSTAVARPLMSLQKIFQFKRYFNLYLFENDLFANNIIIKDIGVCDYFKEKMYELEISSILIDDDLTPSDLETFVDRFVKRVPTSSSDYFTHKFLENRKVKTIKVNSELGEKLFKTGLRYRSDIGEDYSVRRLVGNCFSGSTQLAVDLLSSSFEDTRQQAEATGIDYHIELVKHILPEKFAQLPIGELLDMARQIISEGSILDGEVPDKLEHLVKACDYHPRRDDILEKIRELFVERGIDESVFARSLNQVGSLKLEAVHAVDNIYRKIFSDDFGPDDYDHFHDAFVRLLRTRQMNKAAKQAEAIIEQLASETPAYRQHAIVLLEDIIKSVLAVNEFDFFDILIRHLQSLFTQGRETFEFSQVVTYLLKAMLALRRYERVAEFLKVLQAGRHTRDEITVYDSVTVKKIFDDLNHTELINRLVGELEQPGNNLIKPVREILITIQSEEVALRLAAIVTHQERAIRQHSLKILCELGAPAVKVFSDILSDEANFVRPDNQRELPDRQWYLVRNAIFVLGNLGNPAACRALRLRLADPDVRVRRELVGALEKIEGDDAVDLLTIMAEDINPDIREAAIIVLGLTRREGLFPFYADLLSKQKEDAARIINAIALINSKESHKFLSKLADDNDRLKSLSSAKASAKDIRGVIKRSLEKANAEANSTNIGGSDQKSADKSTESEDSSLSRTARLLLKRFQQKK